MKIYIDCFNATTIVVDSMENMVKVIEQQVEDDKLEASNRNRPYAGTTLDITIEDD